VVPAQQTAHQTPVCIILVSRMPPSMLRIYCDFNNAIDESRYSLNCVGSLRDVEQYASQLSEGLRVVLYQTGELEVEGTIYLDPTCGWVGVPDWSTKKYVDETSNC
jgi:hypothetical protein